MKESHTLRGLIWLFLVVFVVACSSDEPIRAEPAVPTVEEPTSVATNGSTSGATEATTEATREPAVPTIADEDLAGIVQLDAGELIEDVQGNLVAIYGYDRWPASFADLSDEAQSAFPFLGDFVELDDPLTELVVIDVAMCSAGIDAGGFGTAEFFVHSSPTEPLLTGVAQGHGLFAAHPAVAPGFTFPNPADCTRGWVPVLWASAAQATTARYLVTTRTEVGAQVERYLYQWEIALADTEDIEADTFDVGQMVTFNDGPLANSTVQVDGWAELIGSDGPLDGTRLVAVKVTACPSNNTLPDFGLALDGWNLTAPLNVAEQAAVVEDSCFDGWLEFAVPFGAVPTGFFASDGADATYGYAEWSLANAAIASPGD